MKRRVKALLLAALMVVSMVLTEIPVARASETQSGLAISSIDVNAGETFTIELKFPAIPAEQECLLIQGDIEFDTEAFEVVEIAAEEIASNYFVNPEEANEYGVISILLYENKNPLPLENGYAATITLKAKENLKGSYEFELVEYLVSDADLQMLVEGADVTSVSINVVIPATKVTIDSTALTLAEGETASLTATLTPGNTSDTAAWSSSDATIVKVDETGTVTAVKPGKAIITVTAGSVSATCEVTVTCSHKETTAYEKVEPTCTTPGHEAYEVCNTCGEVVSGSDVEIAVIPHTLVDVVAKDYEVTAPTCTEKGVYHKTCSVCGYVSEETFEVGALGHDFSEHKAFVEPTCEATGTKEYFDCSRCDAVSFDGTDACAKEELVISALGHNLKYVAAVAATCDEDGNIEYWTCTVCGKLYKDAEAKTQIIEKETIISATGHSNSGIWETDENYHWKNCGGCGNLFKYEEGEHVYAETLESDGEYHWKECTICGYITGKEAHVGGSATCLELATCTTCGTKYADLGAHNFAEVVDAKYLAKAATCTTKAVYYQSCTVCGEAHETITFEAGEALGHDYQAVAEVAPKCEETGTKAHYVCSRCDVISLDKAVTCEKADLVIPATGHGYAQVEKADALKSAATCTEKAVYYESCTACGKVNKEATFEVGEALGHEYEVTEASATCTTGGYATYACIRCDHSYKSDYVDALGHSFENYVADGDATCTEDGTKTAKCERCDATETIANIGGALGHDHKAVVTAPTCTAAGYTTYTCARCQDTYKADEVAALGHDRKAVVTAPTCTEVGYTTYTCTRCQDTYKTDEVAALGHAMAEVEKEEYLKAEATCVSKAVYYKSCAVCGVADAEATFEVGEVDAANHVGETEVRDAKEATCYAVGYTGDTYCKACDAKLVTGEEIAKLPHNITEWVVTKEPTTAETGLKTGYCTNAGCTEEHTVVIAKLVEAEKEVVVESTEVKVESVVVKGETNVNESVVLQVENVTNTISEAETATITESVKTLEEVKDNAEVIKVLDISMLLREETSNGDVVVETEFELQGSVEIKIQLSDELVDNYENLVLVHVKDDGTVEVVPYTIDENNVVTFVANGFSYYTFVGTEKAPVEDSEDTNQQGPTSPTTGDASSIVLWVALAVVALGAAVVVIRRRQR